MSQNRLAEQTSPYLLQHKDNPVDWWPWGEAALAEAKRTGKPILLSVGYAACHWCHVMAHESFEDPATAEVMNRLFINIKVDREERPDIDAIYMGALHRLGEQGGWPLTMFLDSEARPFWGGTYFPREAMYGRPSFVTVLLRMAEAYQNQPDDVASNASKLVQSLASEAKTEPGPWVNESQIADLITRLAGACDPLYGGLKGAPKFPQWNVFWLLWRGAIRFNDAAARAAVVTLARHLCQGGIYDHLGGGFARYSVDDRWLVPHFEKMLYDNALIVDLLTEVWRETQDPLLELRVRETVDWLDREMRAGNGAFAASLDADSEGEEGKFYVWSREEIFAVLGDDDGTFFANVYDVTDSGNFEGANILNRLGSMDLRDAADEHRLAALRARLLAHRAARIRPATDDKVLADWNGLMIAALARAGLIFNAPAWCELAKRAFDAVVATMTEPNGRLRHSWREDRTSAPATASDYANMIWAAIRLFETHGDGKLIDQAKAWTAILDQHYWDETRGGYFTAADDTKDVIVRMKSAADDAVPSANAVQLANLFALSALTGDIQYGARAELILAGFSSAVAQRPVGHCGLIAASLDGPGIMQIVSGAEAGTPLPEPIRTLSTPGALILAAGPASDHILARTGNAKTEGALSPRTTVCGGNRCLPPPQSVTALRDQLLSVRQSETKLA